MSRFVQLTGLARLAGILAVVAPCAVLGASCTDEQIVLATLPANDDAGRPTDRMRCVSDTDCPSDAFCSRKLCSDVGGICSERPDVCDATSEPVCGCDGITYWNDCLRRAAGITAKADDECDLDTATQCTFLPPQPGAPVEPAVACPSGTYCARLFPEPMPGMDECPVAAPGTCWYLPTVCPTDPGIDRWTECGGDGSCRTSCDAIRSGDAHQRAETCP